MADNIVQKNTDSDKDINNMQHIFIIGAKSIGQYGGFETFVYKLTEQHQNDSSIKYHIACKANGYGYMDESKISGISDVVKNKKGEVIEFVYHNAHIFKIKCPNIGPAMAIYYDKAAALYSINYCIKNDIKQPIFYILTCRIGLFISILAKKIKSIGGKYYLNPDGHEWLRAKWSAPVRKYWKWSEKKMVSKADMVICDSVNIEKYIKEEYKHPNTTYIAYGSDTAPSKLTDDDSKYLDWMNDKSLKPEEYYLIVGRFVRENNYETILREYMNSNTSKDFAIITNSNVKYLNELEQKVGWKKDPRIKFVGTVYDQELLKKIRENAYGYFHGHEVGGTNPSLLEALGSTNLNMLLDVGFNKEVAKDAALYWNKNEGSLKNLIEMADKMSKEDREKLGQAAKDRINAAYNWAFIGSEYKSIFTGFNEEKVK